MARQLKGVGGVLGGLISESPEQAKAPTPQEAPEVVTGLAESAPEVPDSAEQTRGAETAGKAKRAKNDGPSEKLRVRRGRPPKRAGGGSLQEAVQREKVTLRLNADLMNQYRDWTWEQRCQLHDLIEGAMAHYLKRRQSRTEP
jgi:hypothetical protein